MKKIIIIFCIICLFLGCYYIYNKVNYNIEDFLETNVKKNKNILHIEKKDNQALVFIEKDRKISVALYEKQNFNWKFKIRVGSINSIPEYNHTAKYIRLDDIGIVYGIIIKNEDKKLKIKHIEREVKEVNIQDNKRLCFIVLTKQEDIKLLNSEPLDITIE